MSHLTFYNGAPLGPAPRGALHWLRRSQIVNFGSQYAYQPVPERTTKDGKGFHDEWLREHLGDIPPFDKESYVFDLLQRDHQWGDVLNADALQVLLQSLIDTMPEQVRMNVGFHMNAPQNEADGNTEDDTGPVLGSRDWFACDDDQFNKLLASIASGKVLPLDSNNKEFILWVVNTGTNYHDHYVTIVLHYEASDPDQPEVLDQISDWAIVDALDGNQEFDTSVGTQVTRERLYKLLGSHGISSDNERPIFINAKAMPARGNDSYISGYVAYDVISQLLERIGIMYHTGRSFEPEQFFSPTRPWFSFQGIRAELLGRAGFSLLKALKWKMRLAAFPVQVEDMIYGTDNTPPPRPLTPPPMRLPLPDGSYDGGSDTLFKDTADPYKRAAGGSGGQSVSSSSTEIDSEVEDSELQLFSDEVALYYQRKQDERDVAVAEGKRADEACSAALKFARRVQHEVLESPTDNMPSAYAVEKLFGLVRRAIEKSLSTNILVGNLERRYVSEDIHNAAMNQFATAMMYQEFDQLAAHRLITYTEADMILQRASRARQRAYNVEWDDNLAEVSRLPPLPREEEPTTNFVTTGQFQSSATGPAAGSGLKRRFDFETTSAADDNGEEVYTMHIQKKQRVVDDIKLAKKTQKVTARDFSKLAKKTQNGRLTFNG